MPEFKAVLDSPTVYRTQIYFSKIRRDKNGKVHFKDYHFKKHNLYYYPASCVKLPVILTCLDKLERNHLSIQNKLFIEDTTYCGFAGQTEIKNGWSFADYMKRMLVVSNNICFNPLYDFYDPQLFKIFWHKSTLIHQRFNYNCDSLANTKHFPLSILDSSTQKILLHQKEYYNINNLEFDKSWANAGLRYLDAKDSLINYPKSFSKANFIPLATLQYYLKNIVADKNDYKTENGNFLLKYMSIYPSECRHPAYDAKEYPDNWGKYLLIGDDTAFKKNDSIRIFNKVGMAYGFLTDCAYIVDYKNQVEFVVSASVFVDRDGTLNDGKYAYKEIGLPFLGKLGRVLMQHELKHKRKSKFAAPKMEYND